MDPDGFYKFLIEKRGNKPDLDSKGKWCLPCGYLDWDESGSDAARRELWEEVGLEPNHFIEDLKLTTFHHKLRFADVCNKNFIFTGTLNENVNVLDLTTNDKLEVSHIHSLLLVQILTMYKHGMIHAGSVRILLLNELGVREGKLHKPVLYDDVYY
jgi:8-oxo-dGTP pyrophosphatase MutT (NUDIX family)